MARDGKNSTSAEIQRQAQSEPAALQWKIRRKQCDIWTEQDPRVNALQTGVGPEHRSGLLY
jgi:hypothetical protein